MRRRVAAGDSAAAEAFVCRKRRDDRHAAAKIARIAQAGQSRDAGAGEIGFQYISKIRFTNGGAMRRVLYRWRKETDGKWAIVSVEDTTGKRSSWSDIPDLAAAVAQARAGNGNA